ncbi:MAG: nucleoside-diphosphate kinase, partial [Patescibacteria group bacterium]
IGKMVRGWLLDFMCSGPVVKMVIKGVHAVDMVRKLAGSTMPSAAEMGTIRGDFSVDSAAAANRDQRSVHNIVHASETPEEAKHEIAYWFSQKEINDYKRTDEELTF